MRRKRSSEARLAIGGPACLALLTLGGATACDSYTTLIDSPVDCTVEDQYEFLPIAKFTNFDTVGENDWWPSPDSTPGAAAATTVGIENLPDGPRCNSNAAAVLRAAHNNDWGCLFGLNSISAQDASAYEGLSLWARAPNTPAGVPTTKGFQILLSDPNTVKLAGTTSYCIDFGAGGAAQPTISVYVDGQQVSTSGTVTRPTFPDECGNSYNVVMLATSEWALYTIPFGRFQQDPKPNRVPNAVLTHAGTVPGTGLLTDQILQLIVRMPKEATEELWIDNLAWYRRKPM